jgi:hypothetical protein
MFRAIAYWTALMACSAFLLAVSAAIVATYVDVRAHARLWSDDQIRATVLAYGGLLISGLTALAGIFFGWRKDRRDAKEFRIRVRELERKLGAQN